MNCPGRPISDEFEMEVLKECECVSLLFKVKIVSTSISTHLLTCEVLREWSALQWLLERQYIYLNKMSCHLRSIYKTFYSYNASQVRICRYLPLHHEILEEVAAWKTNLQFTNKWLLRVLWREGEIMSHRMLWRTHYPPLSSHHLSSSTLGFCGATWQSWSGIQ